MASVIDNRARCTFCFSSGLEALITGMLTRWLLVNPSLPHVANEHPERLETVVFCIAKAFQHLGSLDKEVPSRRDVSNVLQVESARLANVLKLLIRASLASSLSLEKDLTRARTLRERTTKRFGCSPSSASLPSCTRGLCTLCWLSFVQLSGFGNNNLAWILLADGISGPKPIRHTY
jgi:hypothetical protein